MSINTKSNATIAAIQIYSLDFKNKTLIDEEFDKFYQQKRIKYSKTSTRHDYSIFVT